MKKEFSKSFINSDTVLLCPIYRAGENIKLKFSYEKFANSIIKNSNVKLILIKNELELYKYIKNVAYGNKIFIGMGAGSISNWLKNIKIRLNAFRWFKGLF